METATISRDAERGREEDLSGSPSGPASAPQPPVGSERGGERGILLVSYLASAVVHVLVIVLYSFLGSLARGRAPPGVLNPPPAPEGIEVIRLLEVLADLSEPAPPPAAPERALPAVQPLSPGPLTADPAESTLVEAPDPSTGIPSVAERLRPGEVDERLWRIDPDLIELSDRELARLLLAWTIEELGDSALSAEARARAATDWTYTDSEGKRWGISAGRLHLGDLSIPLPFSFSAPPGSEAARRAWEDAEIARAAASAAARANMQERVKAIRERRDREREEAQTVPPDTTRIRR